MERILKPYRIIPDELYVLREADHQLKSIIEDMASPGYVLVSRQMGKTNLLLHAKNSYQGTNDVYVYFDLSNSFSDEYQCFRSLIDKAIDTNDQLLNHLIPQVKEIRSYNYPAHIEHLRELRLILQSITGKMVIIFDEIDALTRASFSDKIFSQIRSIYFERDNYKELSRLTYILSGVAEPTEIIKDPKISPFNIGQKIFLDDFSYLEHSTFITKANLKISLEISKHIYSWTSGNPRMTYDICSEVELLILNNVDITINDIDDLVKKLYLTTYDKAPIDHIRELVEHDKEIRDAIMVIRYGKGGEISDSTKVKLYLSGIVNSDFTAQKIKIKNNIINESLNEKWLYNLERKKKNINELIAERINTNQYSSIIDIYNQYNLINDGQLTNSTYYNIGLAFYRNLDFKKAIEVFDKASYDHIYEKSYYLDKKFLRAECYSNISELDKAIEEFEDIIKYDDGGKYYYHSKLSIARTLLNKNFKENHIEAINLFEEILNNIKSVEYELDSGHSHNIIISTHLYYGILLADLQRIDEAKVQYEKALTIAKPINIPQILLQKYELEVGLDEKRLIIEKIIKVVYDEKLIPNLNSDKYSYFSIPILHNILREINSIHFKLFNEFCEYIQFESYKINGSYGETLYSIGLADYTSNDGSLTKALFKYLIFKSKLKIEAKITQICYQVVSSLKDVNFMVNYLDNYLNFLFTSKDIQVTIADINILLPAIDTLHNQGEVEKSKNIIVFLKNIDKTDSTLKSATYIIDFYEVKHLLESRFNSIAFQRGKALLNLLNNLTDTEINSNPILKSSYSTLRSSLNNLLPRDQNLNSVEIIKNVQFKDLDRVNAIYKNGVIKNNVKFRKVKNDYENGICEIIKK